MEKLEKSLNVPNGTIEKVHAMAKECCMNCSGVCDILDCKCVVAQDGTIIECSYFVGAVLPANQELYNKVMEFNGHKKLVKKFTKKCKDCGKNFKSDVKNETLCPKCKKKRLAEQKRAYKKRQSIK